MKIFPVYYFPPIAWFAAALDAGEIVLERHEFYRKQNYFNRMQILGANKVLKLTIPILKAREHTPLLHREISFTENWARDHWISITSAYRSSPYFEFYESQLEPFFTQVNPNLFDHNRAIIDFFISALQIELPYTVTENFQPTDHYEADFRQALAARGESKTDWFQAVPYPQVFGEAFAPNLSILDLLCNMGPRSSQVLRESIRKN